MLIAKPPDVIGFDQTFDAMWKVPSYGGESHRLRSADQPAMCLVLACLKRILKLKYLVYHTRFALLAPACSIARRPDPALGAPLANFVSFSLQCRTAINSGKPLLSAVPLGDLTLSRGDVALQCDTEILYRKRMQVVYGNPHLQRVATSS